MQLFAFFACFTSCLTLLLLPCESKRLKRRNSAPIGNEVDDSRCDWHCVIVDSDFGKDIKKLITEYRRITLDLAFEQRVDEKCLNQTMPYNATKPADSWTWLTDNTQSRRLISALATRFNGSIIYLFRKSLIEGQIKVSISCDFRPTFYPAVTIIRTPGTGYPAVSESLPASNSINDLIAVVLLKSVANSTGGLSFSGTTLCYKESSNYGSYACLNAVSRLHPGLHRTFEIVAIFISIISMLYSPIMLCLFTPTEVNTEREGCVIVLSGTCPVGIRRLISNFFSTKSFSMVMFITTLPSFVVPALIFVVASYLVVDFRDYFAPLVLFFIPHSYHGNGVLDVVLKSMNLIFISCVFNVLVSPLVIVPHILLNKLSIRSECFICKCFGEADRTIVHQELLEELKQHLRAQPSIVVRCFTEWFEILNLIRNFVRRKITVESTCWNIIILICLAPYGVAALVITLAILPVKITLLILYSCPLSTLFFVVVLPAGYRQYRPTATSVCNQVINFLKIMLLATLRMCLFGSLVVSNGLIVGQITVLSLVVVREILLGLQGYLPYATLLVVIAYYFWGSYNSFTRKYHNLAFKLYKQNVNAKGGEDQLVNPREDTVPVIPKGLFEKACKELMPLRVNVGILVVQLISLLAFFFLVFAVVMETPEASDRTKATATFFTALFPKIITMVFSKDPSMEKLHDEVLDKKVKSIVDNFSSTTENSRNGGDTSVENSGNNNITSAENERTELLNNAQSDVQDFGTFEYSRNTDETS